MTDIRIRKPEDITIEPVEGHKLGDIALVTRALTVLTDHYPGYTWRVGIHDEPLGGVMYILNMDVCAAVFGNKPYGYVLKLTRVYSDPVLRCVLMAGGEILERARLARSRATGVEPKRIDGVPEYQQPIPGITIH